MAKNIEPKLRKIGDYLKQKMIRFSLFQSIKGIFLGNGNCDKLWQDIVDFVTRK